MPTPAPSAVSCTRTTLPFARNRRPGPSGSREGRSTVKSSWLARGGAAEGMHTNNPLMLMSRLNPAPPQGICRSSLHAKMMGMRNANRRARRRSIFAPFGQMRSSDTTRNIGGKTQRGKKPKVMPWKGTKLGQDSVRGMSRAA